MTASPPRERLPHAILDRESRVLKARKIEELVGRDRLRSARVLDIGTGSGVMAAELAKVAREVIGIDVVDQRQVQDGYRFVRVTGTQLPFDDDSFDVVLSNHVIEHVGGSDAQLHHLNEIARVLADGGIVYLATPNRWVVVEPHYRLPLLSWLPRRLRDPYVRLLRRGSYYDCELATRSQLHALFAAAGFEHEEVTLAAARAVGRIESPTGLTRLLVRAPDSLLAALLPVAPTLVFLLRRR